MSSAASAARPSSTCLRQALKAAMSHRTVPSPRWLAPRAQMGSVPRFATSLSAVEQRRHGDFGTGFAGAVSMALPKGTRASSARRHLAITAAGATKQKRGGKDSAEAAEPLPNEKERPDMPWPRNYQQTLSKSFTVSGIGLHSGEPVTVRVRPAFAGEGRYFVRVPEGTNAGRFQHEAESMTPIHQAFQQRALTEEEEERRTSLFLAYLEAQEGDDGFEGTFAEYVVEVAKEPLSVKQDGDDDPLDVYEHDEILARSESEAYMLADISNATDEYMFCTTLKDSNMRLFTVEHLLSALEGSSVDNARIEIEGGEEIPIIDGSALGWTMQIQLSGLRPAPQSADNPEPKEKMVLRPKQVVSVTDGDKFITLYPGEDVERLSYGIDFKYEAPVIGKQWFSWARREDEHYSIAVGAARTFCQSLEKVEEMRENGFIKGGTQDVALVADGENWLDTTIVRYALDEPARHKMLDLIGDLSLMASGGNQALPIGHIVAYKAGHSLHLKFAKALRAACDSPDDWEPALPWDLSVVLEEARKAREAEAEEDA